MAGKRIQLLLAATLAVASTSTSYAYLSADEPLPTSQPPNSWIVQVGALESEAEAKQRIDLARSKASSLLSKADPFTEPVVAKDNRTLFRARFAGLDRDQAEAVCKTLKRADISCITVRN